MRAECALLFLQFSAPSPLCFSPFLSVSRDRFAVIVMRDFLGSFHNFLLLLPPLLSNSLPADPGTARLLTLESDINEVQEKWRQYRNIVTDGFFLNDSMIVLADFFGGQQDGREEQEEENDVDYHHYFSFQDYMTADSGTPLDIRGLQTNDILTNIDSQENSVEDIVGQENAGTSENIKTDPQLVVADSMNNNTVDEWNEIAEVSNIETETTEGNVGLSKMVNADESLYGQPMSSEQLVTSPGGRAAGNGTMENQSKLDEDRGEPMENSLEPVEGEGKGLEQVAFTQADLAAKMCQCDNQYTLLCFICLPRVGLKTR